MDFGVATFPTDRTDAAEARLDQFAAAMAEFKG